MQQSVKNKYFSYLALSFMAFAPFNANATSPHPTTFPIPSPTGPIAGVISPIGAGYVAMLGGITVPGGAGSSGTNSGSGTGNGSVSVNNEICATATNSGNVNLKWCEVNVEYRCEAKCTTKAGSAICKLEKRYNNNAPVTNNATPWESIEISGNTVKSAIGTKLLGCESSGVVTPKPFLLYIKDLNTSQNTEVKKSCIYNNASLIMCDNLPLTQ